MTFSARFAGPLLAATIAAPLLGAAPEAHADAALERERLALIARQLAHLDRQADELQGIALSLPPSNTRYRFDYSRLKSDLQRVRAGIDAYLSPSRTQPRDAGELIAGYIGEAREDEAR
jgi:RAQPRD family integrative conjugative element protein